MGSASVVPPLPSGFTLDQAQQGGGVPAPPPGFSIDQDTKARPGSLKGRVQHLEQVNPGMPKPGTPERADAAQSYMDAAKTAVPIAAGVLAPEALPAIASPMLAGAATGAVSGAATTGTAKLMGAPVTPGDIAESAAGGAAFGGATGLLSGWLNKLFSDSKAARGMVNSSVGASARDVTYGNPAKAILDENITASDSGDIEKYKDARRAGMPPAQAMVQAGGRIGQVQQKINELAPQLDKALSSSTIQIPVSEVIDKPITDVISEIRSNRAILPATKLNAINQLMDWQASLKQGLGPTISPAEANRIKQDVGNVINWAGNLAITDDVRPAYNAVYESLKRAVHSASPDAAQIDERLTNLLSARTDLIKLMKAEEVGQGRGVLGAAVSGTARRAEAVAGGVIPKISSGAGSLPKLAVPIGATIGEQLKAKGIQIPQQQQQQPDVPFHPGEGISR